MNGLRTSRIDANTKYQSVATSNIALTTSGITQQCQHITFNIGNGIKIGQISSSGLYLGINKAIGLETAAPTTNTLAVNDSISVVWY